MSGFRRSNHGSGHSYYLGDRKLDGVTTILSKCLPKHLTKWAAETAAGYVVDNWDELAAVTPSERLKRISKAPNAARDAAAVRGTKVHALADKLANGHEVTVPDELAGHVDACVKFLDEWNPQPILTETPVYHDTYLYAGTLDLLAGMDDGEGQGMQSWLLDFKTSKSGVYGETAFQLAAYANATWCLKADGTIGPMPIVDRYAVVWLRSDGYDLYEYHVDRSVFREFLYIQQCAKAAENCRDYRGDALTPPVRTQT